MKISLSSLCIITLLLCSCTAKKTDDAYYDYYNDDKNYISTSRVRPVFYSSGFAAEGNDYYYISKSKHKLKDVEDRVYQTPSVPSRYIVDIDAKWQSLFGFVIEGAKERGIKKNISTPVIDRFFVKLYDIETKELVKTVNVKKLIKNIDDEIASYMAEGDYKPTFEGMIVWDNESIDGEKHKVHSAEEWYEYYKYYKPEDLISEWMSPILPREPKY